MKLRKSDRLFREYMLKLKGYKCARCGKVYTEDNCRGLHVSHYWGRARENTRHDVDNCDLLCYGCHQIWGHGDGRGEYTTYMLNKLGGHAMEMLELRAHTTKKKDERLDEVVIKELLKEV